MPIELLGERYIAITLCYHSVYLPAVILLLWIHQFERRSQNTLGHLLQRNLPVHGQPIKFVEITMQKNFHFYVTLFYFTCTLYPLAL